MSPDIEWRIGEEANQEILARVTTKPRRTGAQRLVLIVMVAVGIGLGIAYHSIPEPIAPSPPAAEQLTPTPAPTLSPPLELLPDSITREARALAMGDQQMFAALQDQADQSWLREQLAAFETWGSPSSNYTIAISGTLPNDRAWAEVIQYRNGQYFRQLRFYRLAQNRLFWLRTRPVLDMHFWGRISAEVNSTEHFAIVASERDAFEAWGMARQFEQLYAEACNGLGCWSLQPDGQFFTLVMAPEIEHASVAADDTVQHVTVTLPSPLIMGVYQPGPNYPDLGHDDRIVNYFDRFVYPWMVYTTTGGFARWSKSRDGLILVWAISNWAETRLGRAPGDATFRWSELVSRLAEQPLDALWSWSEPIPENRQQLLLAQATALVRYIAERYGPDKVIALLRAIRTAPSLSAALEASGLSYEDIAAHWDEWLQRLSES